MILLTYLIVFFFKQKTAYELRISDWSSDVCSSDLDAAATDEIGFLKLRYKLPQASDSTLVELPITTDLAVADLAVASDDARWAAAVAAFGQIGRASCRGRVCQYV